jgi:hypothetical protein
LIHSDIPHLHRMLVLSLAQLNEILVKNKKRSSCFFFYLL